MPRAARSANLRAMTALASGTLVACHGCDLLHRETALAPGGVARCRRCGSVLYRRSGASLDRAVALTLTALVLLAIANAFPIVSLEFQGQRDATTLLGAVDALYREGKPLVASLVLATTVLAPTLELLGMLYVVLPLRFGRVPRFFAPAIRLMQALRPWAMVEVFMLGLLVSLVKLGGFATVIIDKAFWSFGALMVIMAAWTVSLDVHELWSRVQARAAS
jgi:paraquat-inducible protein A